MTSSESQLLDLVDLMEKLSPPTREVNGTAQLALETYRNDDILLWKLTGEPLDAIVVRHPF